MLITTYAIGLLWSYIYLLRRCPTHPWWGRLAVSTIWPVPLAVGLLSGIFCGVDVDDDEDTMESLNIRMRRDDDA